jgi:multiple sugar transport system permease protein
VNRVFRGATPYLLVAPAFTFLSAFLILPLLLVVVLSFFDANLLSSTVHFVGLGNYVAELGSGEFRESLLNTVVYALYLVPVSIVLGLVVALLVNRLSHGQGFWRSVYFLPVATTLVAMASVWRWLFTPDTGIVDRLLGPILGVRDWLNHPHLALLAIAVVGIWHQIGFVAIVYLAALAALPRDQYDSAAMDGARAWSRFWHVTWPAIGPTTVFVTAVTCGTALQAYDSIVAMTGGGPAGATQTLTFAIWQRGINYFDLGLAAVLSVVLLALSLLVTLLQRTRTAARLEQAGFR